ncbi:MAG TPA: acyltransferase family protein [Rhizomicrobium sp.]|jgi:peptidoglycan/LPS O-acetylase OafA/YrhL|nr:acyltransferase family protein [Rhizomicrobium sp.]
MKVQPAELHYRPDVDGLRAVAIVPVVLYHFGFWQFAGGFVGVDVFFVISGFLITGLIHREMVEGRFTIREFYERRIRRIFPALFVMLIVVTVVAALLLFPSDFERYAQSLIATAFFSSNFEFWREAGYFDAAASSKPLLHLWSIAVEEQFYLLFPPLLLLVGTRSRMRLLWLTGTLLVASFAFSVWAVAHAPTTAFYLLPSRTWELMLGAMLALAPVGVPSNRFVHDGVGMIGLAMIGAAIWLYQPCIAFPGLAALLPCVGAALVIYAGQQPSLVRSVLAAKPVVFVGLISYSLYLWHWPVVVFARNIAGRELSTLEAWALIALSFVLAIGSWKFIETPIRRGLKIGWRPLFTGAASVMAATAACGVAIAAERGLPERWQPEIRRILAEERNHEPRMDICFGLSAHDVKAGRLCRIGSTAVKTPSFLLWGDSHADALLPAVQKAAQLRQRSGLFAGSGSCAPLVGMTRSDVRDCKPFNDAVMQVALKKTIGEVILDARWSKNANDPDTGGADVITLSDDAGASTDRSSMEAVFYRSLERTVRILTQAGKHVVIVAPVPEAAYSVPRTMARLRLAGDKRDLARDVGSYFSRQRFVLGALGKMRAKYGVQVIYPHQTLCASGACEFALNDRPLYRDEHHLSVFGALQLVPLMSQAF